MIHTAQDEKSAPLNSPDDRRERLHDLVVRPVTGPSKFFCQANAERDSRLSATRHRHPFGKRE